MKVKELRAKLAEMHDDYEVVMSLSDPDNETTVFMGPPLEVKVEVTRGGPICLVWGWAEAK